MPLPIAILFAFFAGFSATPVNLVTAPAHDSNKTAAVKPADAKAASRAGELLALSDRIFKESKADLAADARKSFETFVKKLAARTDTDAQMLQSQIFMARLCQRMVDRGREADGRIRIGNIELTDALGRLCPFYPLCEQAPTTL